VVRLRKVNGQLVVHGQIESVEPNHGLLALVSVVVPLPLGCEDDIPGLHVEFVALDGGEGAGALDDETQGKGIVPVGGRDFAGVDELETSVDGVGRERGGYIPFM
jgi:hypothetical protein